MRLLTFRLNGFRKFLPRFDLINCHTQTVLETFRQLFDFCLGKNRTLLQEVPFQRTLGCFEGRENVRLSTWLEMPIGYNLNNILFK